MNVTFENVSMNYGDKKVLENLTFSVNEGNLISLLGPSGCGKSTTLMLMSGLLFPTAGKILFNGKDVTKKDPTQRNIGMVFQNYALYPHMKIIDNIMFPLKMHKVPKKEALERAHELAKLVQIEEHINKKPAQLSGGQQQRVAIARALAKKPSLLLMDEPLSNLDAKLRVEMREEIKRIQEETKVTTVFVTHDQEEAIKLSDEIIVLNGGHIQQKSTPQELYLDPDNSFVADFIGSSTMNHFDKAFLNSQRCNAFGLDGKILPAISKVFIRAENIFVCQNESESFASGSVDYIEVFGQNGMMRVNTGEEIIVVSGKLPPLPLGSNVKLMCKKEDVFLFNDQGQRVR